MQILSIRHDWPEKAGFRISRPNGLQTYTFLHFTTPVKFQMGDRLIQARPGVCIFFSPGTPQYFSSSEPVMHNWMHADASLSRLLERYGIPQNCLLYPSSADFISRLFHKIETEVFSTNPHKEDLIEAYINEFLIRLSRSLEGVRPGTSRQEQKLLSQIRRQILSQPEKHWTVPQMAALANLSTSRFHVVYRSLFGTAPMQDLIDARTTYAQSLLLSREDLTLPEVAEQVGYRDQYHFIRQFKSQTGLTPGAYRRQNRV